MIQQSLSNLIGLEREKSKAQIAIRASQSSGTVFSHTLLYGIGGTGKTALARAIVYELGYYLIETHAASFKKRDELFSDLLNGIKSARSQGCSLCFFIDEVHRLRHSLQEALYPVMQEFWIPFKSGRLDISPFTLMAATTRFDMLDSNSFVTRFANCWEIERYAVSDIASLVAQEFRKMQLGFSKQVVYEVAKRCLGIPRIAVLLCEKVKIGVLASESHRVEMRHVMEMFKLEGVDSLGLHDSHRRYLAILASSKSRPMGVSSIANKMRQHEDVIRDTLEPILLELDMVICTPRGRILTDKGVVYVDSFSRGGVNFSSEKLEMGLTS